MFAAPSIADAHYVADLHWTSDKQQAYLAVWEGGEWQPLEVKGEASESGEFITY